MRATHLSPAVASVAFLFLVPLMDAETPPDRELGTGKEMTPLVTLEQKLIGAWAGPPCGGDWIFSGDNTFEAEYYSPGGNRLTGHWEMRWEALPPTLRLTVETSDAPERLKVGEIWELKVIRLDDETLGYVWPQRPERPILWSRVNE